MNRKTKLFIGGSVADIDEWIIVLKQAAHCNFLLIDNLSNLYNF